MNAVSADSGAELFDFDGNFLWGIDAADKIRANSSEKHFEISKTEFSKFDLSKAVLKTYVKNESLKQENLFFFKNRKT